ARRLHRAGRPAVHPRRTRRARRRLAAQARPVSARDERARRLRRGRRPRALDQARGQRCRRGLDGRLARPPVSGRRMSTTAISVPDLGAVDLCDDLTDAELEPWAAAAHPHEAQPGDALAEQGEAPATVTLLLEGTAQALLIESDRSERVGGRHRAPTWMGAIAALTGGPLGVRMVAETPCRMALIPVEDFR